MELVKKLLKLNVNTNLKNKHNKRGFDYLNEQQIK